MFALLQSKSLKNAGTYIPFTFEYSFRLYWLGKNSRIRNQKLGKNSKSRRRPFTNLSKRSNGENGEIEHSSYIKKLALVWIFVRCVVDYSWIIAPDDVEVMLSAASCCRPLLGWTVRLFTETITQSPRSWDPRHERSPREASQPRVPKESLFPCGRSSERKPPTFAPTLFAVIEKRILIEFVELGVTSLDFLKMYRSIGWYNHRGSGIALLKS